MNLRAPKGTDDILPPQSRIWRRTLRAWEDWSERFGYDLIMLPAFEATELFERGVGGSTEVVQKQMYTFEDKGGRSITLRPEGTAGVVRAFLETGAAGELKVAYSGPMFRYERPQAGRRRQFHQVGAEWLGTAEPTADVEIIELTFNYLTEAGVPGIEVVINSLGDEVCRPTYVEELRAYLEERKGILCDESRSTLAENPLRVLDCKECAPKLGDAPSLVLCDPCQTHYESVKQGLERREIPFRQDRSLVRGLDYYTRTAFECIATGLSAAQNAVGGGGRYDGLAEALGGKAVPGVGVALGIDRIILARGDLAEPSALDVFLIVSDQARRERAEALLSELRRDGFRADMVPDSRSVKAQFKAAGRRQARAVCVLGEDDQQDRVSMRANGAAESVPIEGVAEWLRR